VDDCYEKIIIEIGVYKFSVRPWLISPTFGLKCTGQDL